jgi:hypothetical protein
MSSIEDALRVSKNTSRGVGAPVPLIWLASLLVHYPLLGYFSLKILRRRLPSFGLCKIFFKLRIPCLAAFVNLTYEYLGVRFKYCSSYSHDLKLSKPQQDCFVFCNVVCALEFQRGYIASSYFLW